MIQSLDSLPLLYTGKVREVFDAGDDRLLLVTSRRVSAYDVVFPEPVPKKGEVLNLLSAWWFERTRHIVPNHLIETRVDRIFVEGANERETLQGRVALGKRAEPIRFECVVRGHLDGSGWREYEKTGEVAGYRPPAGLRRYDALPEPIFTPATKNDEGHDENITVAQMASAFGEAETRELQELSLALYRYAYEEVGRRGLILLDTKFEFGRASDGTLLLIDEIFTPDSSRYRFESSGGSEALALDKQFLRDWLQGQGFMGEGTPPALPPEVTGELGARYERAFRTITGEDLQQALAERG